MARPYPAEPQAGRRLEAERAVEVLDRLAGCALAEVVFGADDDRAVGEPVVEDPDLGPVGVLDAGELGRHSLGQDGDDGAARVGLLEQPAEVGAGGANVAGGNEAAPDGQEVGREGDREAEQLRDLGHVLVGADAIRRHVLEHCTGMGRRLQRAARPGHAGEPVYDDGSGLDRILERREREEGRGGVAPGIRNRDVPRRERARSDRTPSLRGRPEADA